MITRNIQYKKWLSPETRNIIQQVTANVDAQIDFAAYALSLYEPFSDMVDLSKATLLQRKRFFKLMEMYCADNSVNYSLFKDDELKRRCRSIQIETIENKIELMPDKALSYFYLGDLYYAEGMPDEAMANYSKSLRIKPDNAEAHSDLGNVLAQQGRLDEAIKHYTEALRLRPYLTAVVHNNLGIALGKQGRLDEAIKHLTEALRLKPDFADARKNLKRALFLRDKRKKAVGE